MPSEDVTPTPSDPAFRADPYRFWNRVRRAGPITIRDTLVLTTHADVAAALKDRRLGLGRFGEMREAVLGPGPASLLGRASMLYMDPPEHTRLRTLVAKAFTPRRIESLRGTVQAIVDDLVAAARRRGGMDAIADFAYPLTASVFCAVVGLPMEDRDRFKESMRDPFVLVDSPLSLTPDLAERSHAAAQEVIDYFDAVLARRRADPKDDVLSALIAAEEVGGRLTENEIRATCALLLVAGWETTMGLIGNGILALLRHPAELDRLSRGKDGMRGAIEEMLRFDSPVMLTARVALEDWPIGDRVVREGEIVVMSLAAANRDPARYEEPDRLDLGRLDVEPVSFGGGPHLCLGAALARLEGEVAIGTLVRTFPRLRLGDGELDWVESSVSRVLKSLPLELS